MTDSTELARKSRPALAVFLALTMIVSGHAQAMQQQQPRQSLAEMIGARQERQVAARKSKKSKTSKIIAGVVGVGTALLCGAGKRSATDLTQVACTLAGIAAAYTANLIGEKIAKKLKEQDQKKLLAAAGQSLRSGEPRQLELPDSGATAALAPTGVPTVKEAEVDIFYDTARLTDLNKIRVIAEPYMVKSATNLRANANTSGRVVGRIPANRTLYVAGQVEGQPWYMVSEKIVEGENSAMMAVGYVHADQMRPAASNAALVGTIPPSTVADGRVTAILKCNQIDMNVRDEKGKTTKGSSLLCLGPQGDPISA